MQTMRDILRTVEDRG